MAEVVVRLSLASDARSVRRLRLEALRDNPTAFGSRYEEVKRWSPSQWEEMAAAPSTYLAEVRGRAVGTVRGGYNDRDEPGTDRRWLWGMFVSPEARGGPVGPALVARVVQWARDDAGSSLHLLVATTNGRAEAFYRKQGFVATGNVTPHETRENLWFNEMRHPL